MDIINKKTIYSCFPQKFHNDIDSLYERYSFNVVCENNNGYEINIGWEKILIPYRIYLDEKEFTHIDHLSPRQQQIIHCILTRNHDGFVRQKHLKKIMPIQEIRSAVYILHLIGDYVEQILLDIYDNLDFKSIDLLKQVIAFNSLFYDQVIKSRVSNYWYCYHRRHCRQEDYVGVKILAQLQ